MQFHTIVSLGLATTVATCAAKFGDASARRIGIAFLASWVASLLVDHLRTAHINVVMLAIDATTLVVFIRTSVGSRRMWTVVASAFLAIIVGSHLATLIDFRIQMNTFKFGMAALSYGILLAIVVGTFTGRGARRQREGIGASLDQAARPRPAPNLKVEWTRSQTAEPRLKDKVH